jgi:MinD-like ATPase involved in chromosome partitioning or flagellar assembly
VAVITICSAKGAPGVTTTALLLAALWPRPVLLVDADTDGGDIALRMPDPEGRPLDPARGLLTLLPLARRALSPDALHAHSQTVSGGTPVLAGLAGPEQSGAVGPLWQNLVTAFHGATTDVIVDAGRLNSTSAHLPLARHADVLLTVLRVEIGSVMHTREQQRALAPLLQRPDGTFPRVGTAVVHDVRDPAAATETAEAVRAAANWVEPIGQIADDAEAAGMFAGRPVRRPERSMLVRSGRQIVQNLLTLVPAPPDALTAVAEADALWTGPVGTPSRRSARRRDLGLRTAES